MDNCNCSTRYCYDCEYRYCQNESAKYQKLINRTLSHLEDNLKWIDIDWEIDDDISNKAFERYTKWLNEQGYVYYHDPDYKKYILYRDDGTPVIDCGYHLGILYFHKIKREEN